MDDFKKEHIPREFPKKDSPQRCSEASELIQVFGRESQFEQIPWEFLDFWSIWERLQKHTFYISIYISLVSHKDLDKHLY